MKGGLDLMGFVNSDNKKYRFVLNKKFIVNNSITDRTIKVAESFGLGIDEEQIFTVIDNFVIGFNDGDILYITGDSGSGKSQLLKLLMKNLDDNKYVYEDHLKIDPNETLIDNVGDTLKDAVRILSIVGLNDAYLFLRQYYQLSDGQKLRYKLAKMIYSNKEIFIFDEFCATLDRETAKIVSFNIQKYCRKHNKTLIVATTHVDLKDDLSPNVYLYKKFSDDYIQEFNNEVNEKCSLIKNITYEETKDVKKLHSLEKFHYKGNTSNHNRIIIIKLDNNIIGFMMLSSPALNLKGRNKYLNGKFSEGTSENCVLLNKEIECISRVVIHPKFRAIGLAHNMIKYYLENMTKKRYVETVAVMAKYNPFFEKAGMTLVNVDRENKFENSRIEMLKNMGFDLKLIRSQTYNKSIYEKLSDENKQIFNKIQEELAKKYAGIYSSERHFKQYELCLVSDIKYLIYDNSEKFNEKQSKKIDLTNF